MTKIFLTLLAAITSLSAYAFLGVHAEIAQCTQICPPYVGNSPLNIQCTAKDGATACQYQMQRVGGQDFYCYWDTTGKLQSGRSDTRCPLKVQTVTGNDCPSCNF
ncbi:hypothetical protein PAXRUDRAFT_835584 [Paxillus rubicundulus Ve08.2h10]|uniref:Secreted protein n=1 Tax=Paxillus rubicundulus Ve08.2h10 TaxID=930991 RepID=A0A0D0D6D4_9AGAM|nr:hypothetical protein PAXRUDRAFT_835584 [Paxillus rubicundulus Ve08.2h10]